MRRIAIVSDIHGNRTAFEQVLADLRQTSPDLILHGGDLADNGANPVEVVDRIRDLGWPGVVGNTDEMLYRPEALGQFLQEPLRSVIEEMAAWTRAALGEARLAWLSELPGRQSHEGMSLVHGSPSTPWRAPAPEASDDELEAVYGPLGQPAAIYAHIHRSYIRQLPKMVVANTGSVSLSYDGDPRAAYLLLEDGKVSIRRVAYDVDGEVESLLGCGLPRAEWIARMLRRAGPEMP
jgi:predicted phosphodiesterase